ncbi:MAG: hypothetical protein OXC62_05705 [Aestuariivita sp.]|nr:hypothetical protein [Aestuariivita sp.]
MKLGTVDQYSQLVAYLKVLLPLVALGILSVMFLFLQSVNTTTTLPFEKTEATERLREERVTKPFFVGLTNAGEKITVTADIARPANASRLAEAEGLTALISFSNDQKNYLKIQAEKGVFDHKRDTAQLTGNVSISTNNGYALKTKGIRSSFKKLSVKTNGPIQGSSPLGLLSAGELVLYQKPEENDITLLFNKGVNLLYTSHQSER